MRFLKRYGFYVLAAVLLVSLICSFPASAQMTGQQQQKGMVSVDISSVRNDIARNLNVKVDQIPQSVQAPISVAAQVCNMDANELANKMQSGQAMCQAKTTTKALNQIVLRQMGPSQKY